MNRDPAEAEAKELAQVKREHPGKWIAAIVVERDSNRQPLIVRIVAEHPDRYRLRDYISPGLEVCIFFGGGLTKDGYELAI